VAGLDLRTLTIVDILDALEAGDYTSEELARAYLAQIARYEENYNAFTFIAPDVLAQV
jgi:amidase